MDLLYMWYDKDLRTDFFGFLGLAAVIFLFFFFMN